MSFTCPANVGKNDSGNFDCSMCARQITDFREMSKDEISDVFQANGGSACGIFRSDQLSNSNRSKLNSLFRIAFVAVFFLGLSSQSVLSQDSTIINVDTTSKELPPVVIMAKSPHDYYDPFEVIGVGAGWGHGELRPARPINQSTFNRIVITRYDIDRF